MPAFWDPPKITHTSDSHQKLQISKFQILEYCNNPSTRHTFWSCLIKYANMKWIRLVLWKIQSGHGFVHRQMDRRTVRQTDGMKPVYQLLLKHLSRYCHLLLISAPTMGYCTMLVSSIYSAFSFVRPTFPSIHTATLSYSRPHTTYFTVGPFPILFQPCCNHGKNRGSFAIDEGMGQGTHFKAMLVCLQASCTAANKS